MESDTKKLTDTTKLLRECDAGTKMVISSINEILEKVEDVADTVRVTNRVKVVVPKGTTIYEGIAMPQNIYDSIGNVIGILPGGGNQVYIPTVEARWFQ